MYSHILVPVDGSPFSEQALHAAIELAKREGGQILILSILLEFGANPKHVPKLDQVSEQRLHDYLAGLEREVQRSGVPVSQQIRWGQPAPAIVATARELGVDLIVMASHGVGAAGPGAPPSGLGGVAFKVLYETPCPVLVIPIRPPQAASRG